MADRVAVLSQGRLEQFGSPSDVYDRPQTLFVNTFVGADQSHAGHAGVGRSRPARRSRLDAGAEIIARPAAEVDGGRRPRHRLHPAGASAVRRPTMPASPAWSRWRCRSARPIVHEVTHRRRLGREDSAAARFGDDAPAGERHRGARRAARAALATVFPASL